MLAAIALAFTALRPPPTAGPFGRDFEAYYAAGATFNAGGDPYSRDIWRYEQRIDGVDRSHEELLPFVGPPASLPLWSLVARLPQHTAIVLWTTALGIAFAVLIASALRLARAPRDPLVYVCAAGFAFTTGPAISDFALGQVALVSAAAIGAALLAYDARARAGAIASTLVAALQPNLALVLIARMRARWDIAAAAAAGAMFLVLDAVGSRRPGGIIGYAARLRAHGDAERFVTIQHTPGAIAYAFGASEPAAALLAGALMLAALAAVVVTIVRAGLQPRDAALFATAMLPLAVPFFHEHDFVLLLVPAIVLSVRARGRTRIVAGIGVALVMVDWFGLAQRSNAHGQIVALGLAMAAGYAGIGSLGRGERRAALSTAVAVVAVAACAIPFARDHAAPTWPDTLLPGYRAPAAADASGVWSDEQHAAGLLARDPVWGALRALPLAGAVLMAGAVASSARRRRTALDIDGHHGVERRGVIGMPIA